MRVFSHTCSNTETVCALGCADRLIGVDADSDYPPEVVRNLPRPGRDLNLDVDEVMALSPDLVLTSLTVPGHEHVVDALQARGVRTLVCDPVSLADVFADIRRIAEALDVPERGTTLVREMEDAMPVREPSGPRPPIMVEWWPKPLIVPAAQSWVSDIIHRAGGVNPWAADDVKSAQPDTAQVQAAAPEVAVMSWCGVKPEKYRPEVVRRREGWETIPAIANARIIPVSEEYLGRPGPRLVEGYQRLREAIAALA